jgi:undecaprenyl-diphosphatase
MDLQILEWIQENIVCDWLTPVMKVITNFAELGIGWILIAVLLLCFKKTRRLGLGMGIALLLGVLLGEYGLKLIIQRPRPFTEIEGFKLLIEAHGFSCPSGHTTASFAGAFSIFLYNKKWGVVALVWAALIGFSRMYFFVHYLTDVLLGAALGIACACFGWWLIRKLWKEKEA